MSGLILEHLLFLEATDNLKLIIELLLHFFGRGIQRGLVARLVFEYLEFFELLLQVLNPCAVLVNDLDELGLHIDQVCALLLIKHLNL